MWLELKAELVILLGRRHLRIGLFAWLVLCLIGAWNASHIQVPEVEVTYWLNVHIATVATLGVIFAFISGSTLFGSGFRDGSIRWRIGYSKGRLGVTGAKLIVTIFVGLFITATGISATGLAFGAAKNTTRVFAGLRPREMLLFFACTALAVVVFAILGAGLSGLVRSDIISLGVGLLWIVVIEGLLIRGRLRALAPYESVQRLTSSRPPGGRLVPGVVLCTWAAVAAGAGAARTRLADLP
jgi:hypothetical protein